jgi:hypothetical protein
VDANRSHNWFVRAAAVIGDLSSPFYAEERQRDVWNEASAVALQVLIWLHLLTATAVVWIVGADALPYVYALIAMIGVAGWVAVLYSASLGVCVDRSTRMSRPRVIPLLVLVVLLTAGLVRAQVGDFAVDGWSTLAGMVTGAAVSCGVVVALARFARKRTRGDEQD